MLDDMLYHTTDQPFGPPREDRSAKWCNWMLSIPKDRNPTADTNGRWSSINQEGPHVWLLTGTFGNTTHHYSSNASAQYQQEELSSCPTLKEKRF